MLDSPDLRLDGFIGPGHVSMVIGTAPYELIARHYRRPLVVAGLEAMRDHPTGRESAIVGEVAPSPAGRVLMRTGFGGERVTHMLTGDQLPRICCGETVIEYRRRMRRVAASHQPALWGSAAATPQPRPHTAEEPRTMLTVLMLGFLIGLQHATEADHVAAVASLATRSRSVLDTARQGAVWGLGHTLTLSLFGGAVLVADRLVPERLASFLEMAVGIMLILLALDVLRRLIRERIHFHTHRHGRDVHFHAHSHDPRTVHARDPHDHSHPARFPLRALFVGMMHGMAGSAALILLVLKTVASPWQGIAYIAVFGLGSVVGMAVLAAVISVPLRRSAERLTWAHNGLKAAVGVITLGIGIHIATNAAHVAGLLG